jgi:hypothetical protein
LLYTHALTAVFTLLALHADGQYQANTFLEALYEKMGEHQRPSDPYFLTTWDVSHWIDLVMVKLLREEDATSHFLKRLIKRSNRLVQRFGYFTTAQVSGNCHVRDNTLLQFVV